MAVQLLAKHCKRIEENRRFYYTQKVGLLILYNCILLLVLTGEESGYYWVGAYQTSSGADDWEWIDGTPLDTSKWNPGDPNDWPSVDSCVDIGPDSKSFNLHDYPCANALTFICEIPSDVVAPAP